jgi:predicted MFS family arabinose efflux permease
VILPMAGGLAAPQDRGRIVGIVTSGVVVGILFARTVSGFIANLAGWRSIYIVAAVLNIILIFALRKRIPTAPGGVRMPYPKLILSVFTEARRVKNVGPVLLIGGFGFCALQLFWTAITFLLAAPPFGYNTLEIGLVSLVGVAGALIAAKVGGLMDRGVGIPAQGCFIALGVAAMLVSSLGSHSIILVVLAALLMSLSFQGIGILNQTTLFLLAPKSRSRLNTAFVVNNFIFAAFGSTLAAVLWDYGGWVMVSLGGAASLLIALTVWACAKKDLKTATDAARERKTD